MYNIRKYNAYSHGYSHNYFNQIYEIKSWLEFHIIFDNLERLIFFFLRVEIGIKYVYRVFILEFLDWFVTNLKKKLYIYTKIAINKY